MEQDKLEMPRKIRMRHQPEGNAERCRYASLERRAQVAGAGLPLLSEVDAWTGNEPQQQQRSHGGEWHGQDEGETIEDPDGGPANGNQEDWAFCQRGPGAQYHQPQEDALGASHGLTPQKRL